MRMRWARPLATPQSDADAARAAAASDNPAASGPASVPVLGAGDRLTWLLAQVRRRLRRRETARSSLLWVTASLGSGMGLLSLAAATGPSVLWLPLLTAWTVATGSALVLMLWRAYTHRESDEAIARYIGARVPDLRSDLLSTVQLQSELPHGASRALVAELSRRTAAAAATLEPQKLCDLRPVWQAAGIAGAVTVGAILWAALTYAILTGVSFGLVAAGRLTPQAAAKTLRTTAGVVVFFVGFFGVPGALGALLSQARSGRFALPPVETRGRHSQLQHAWALGAGLGTLHALAIAALALGLGLDRDGTAGPSLLLSRAGVCAVWAGCASACAFVQSLWIARPAALCDLSPPPEPPPTADTRYLLWRMALPQGVGNGVISALIAQYFNVFVLVVQSFQKIPPLKALAPTQSEPPFAIAQVVVLVAFLVGGTLAVMRFRERPLA
mgnify:CR=1 FL=1